MSQTRRGPDRGMNGRDPDALKGLCAYRLRTMYTVIRVLDDDPNVDLAPWVEAVDAASVVPPMHRMSRGRGYVAAICDLPSWDSHLEALQACAAGLRGSFMHLKSGARIVVDVAVYPEDRGRDWLLFDAGFPSDLLAALGTADVELVVSFYAGLGSGLVSPSK